jgi:hypothetical protein
LLHESQTLEVHMEKNFGSYIGFPNIRSIHEAVPQVGWILL